MIKVEYTLNSVEMEPGPNIYFMGKPEDYLKLLNDLHGLAVKTGTEIDLADLGYVEMLDGITYIARSSPNGSLLSKVEDKQISMDLDKKIWKQVMHIVLSISFFPSHNFIEFNELDLREDANVTISSEW